MNTGCALSHWERVARQRRVRAARSTILQIDEIVGRAALIRRSAPPSPGGRRTRFLRAHSLFLRSIVEFNP